MGSWLKHSQALSEGGVPELLVERRQCLNRLPAASSQLVTTIGHELGAVKIPQHPPKTAETVYQHL